jgi:putative DNA modification/repair radical SAM protein
MLLQESQTILEKLEILTDAAKYDVACTSSGVDRKGSTGGMGNAVKSGLCHCFAADGRCISLLKILYTNECIFDCKYCVNRSSNDIKRTSFTPEEVANLTIELYKRNYIEGLFLSSGILKHPNYIMEKLYETLRILREEFQFRGYIHVKAIPGADEELIEKTGWLADRMSVNLELPTSDGLKILAPHKTRKTILKPMKQIQLGMEQNKALLMESRKLNRKNNKNLFLQGPQWESDQQTSDTGIFLPKKEHVLAHSQPEKLFVPAGQSTQMIIGATPESDYQIIQVAEALYQKFDLKRVFYSAFINTTQDSLLPSLPGGPPLLREHRLYQADWLLRFYGFQASELLSEEKPNFNVMLDPKCNWAMNHLELYPVEINKADYYTLLRVPGIGVRSAQRIVSARRTARLDFPDIKKLGVVLKRALYFITCNGKMMYPVKVESDYILSHMLDVKEKLPFDIGGSGIYEQLSLFDDKRFGKASYE